MEARRRAAPFEGSEGRRGLRERGLWRGFEEMVDLKNGFGGEREVVEVEERERAVNWEGMWSLEGREERWGEGLGGKRKWKWEGRRVEREREMEAMEGETGSWVWSSWGSGSSELWILGSIFRVLFEAERRGWN